MTDKETTYYKKIRKQISAWIDSKEGKIHKWKDFVFFAPDLFYLLWKLSFDPKVHPEEKAKLIIAVAYFILPIDLIPEGVIGPGGYIDDIVLAAYALNAVINNTNKEIVENYWLGKGTALEQIKHILNVADEMIGSGLINKLKSKFEKEEK